MLKRTHDAVGEEPCAGGGKVSDFSRANWVACMTILEEAAS